MTTKDWPEFLKQCAVLSAAFDKPVTDTLAKIYFESLKDFDIEQVVMAVNQAVQTKTFLPKAAELRQLIEGVVEDRAAQAWASFLEAVADGGQSSVYFTDRTTAIAMDVVFGGWDRACRMLSAGWVTDQGDNEGGCSDEMIAHYQRSFLRQYTAALHSKREVECYRAGLSEMSMRERGASWSGRIPTVIQPVIFVGQGKAARLRLPFDVGRGQLTEEARLAIGAGWDAVKALAAVHSPALPVSEMKSLPPADEEMATPEEVKALKASIKAFVKPKNAPIQRYAPTEALEVIPVTDDPHESPAEDIPVGA